MGLLGRAWWTITTAASIYTVYGKLKSLSAAKDDLYSQITPEQQEEWKKVFGDPADAKVIASPSLPLVKRKEDMTPAGVVPQLDAVKAGL